MGIAEGDDVIEALPADRADQPPRMPFLPGRPRRDRMIAYTYGCKTFRDSMAVAPVTVLARVGPVPHPRGTHLVSTRAVRLGNRLTSPLD